MERHVIDHQRGHSNLRLPRYLQHEKANGIKGPHHAVTVLRRLPRGSGQASRLKNYLGLERAG